MRDAVICLPVRTAVGRFGGMFKDVPAVDLASRVLRALVDRGLDPARVEDVILGNGYPSGEHPAIGRQAALDAGWPITVPGLQVDRRCGSGLQAVLDAAMRVQTGVMDVVVAGGAESMSQVEHYALTRWGGNGDQVLLDRLARGRVTAGGKLHPVDGGMIETAENLRREQSITREAQDAFSVESHRRAAAAIDTGMFVDEVVGFTTTDRKGVSTVHDTDEHVRRGTTMESLAKLRPVFGRTDPDATVTAGNASGQNDGAAACVVTTIEGAAAMGLRPMARLVSWGVGAVDPSRMGIGPVPASAAALGRAGITLADLDLIELNEAFAAQVLAVLGMWGVDATDDRLNPRGSGISLGHPIGATGMRILASMLHELDRRDGRYALETMCIGGGQGLAAVFERLS
ncbi:MAG: acetyl-CoA C-acetyltransferase [Nitriliruptoraceae bacterium]|jgi:acetyl-CoA C-acetyltransferase